MKGEKMEKYDIVLKRTTKNSLEQEELDQLKAMVDVDGNVPVRVKFSGASYSGWDNNNRYIGYINPYTAGHDMEKIKEYINHVTCVSVSWILSVYLKHDDDMQLVENGTAISFSFDGSSVCILFGDTLEAIAKREKD